MAAMLPSERAVPPDTGMMAIIVGRDRLGAALDGGGCSRRRRARRQGDRARE